MELRDRLSRLGYFKPAAVAPVEPVRPVPRRRAGPELHELVEGAHRVGPEGSCFVAESSYPLDHAHGGVAISDLLGHRGDTFALLAGDPRLVQLDPARAVFLDLETTGLAGGTGTYVFLVGLGYFAQGAFKVEQFFLRDPTEERAMLGLLAETLSAFDAIVSFNGKCFDWPLLETRHIYSRVPLRPLAQLHLDLLFPARRLFKRRVGSCALDSLETAVLGLPPRVGDVPGWLIPTLYFDYLRSGNAEPLVRVVDHNRRDILAMLALSVLMAGHVAEPLGSLPIEPSDLYCLGRLFEERDHLERAVTCYERALAHDASPDDRSETLARLAGVYKRLREADRAIALWESLVADGAASIYPYVELAKHREHRARDHTAALELTRRAMQRHADARSSTPPGRYASEREDLRKREARLLKKLGAIAVAR